MREMSNFFVAGQDSPSPPHSIYRASPKCFGKGAGKSIHCDDNKQDFDKMEDTEGIIQRDNSTGHSFKVI